MSLKILTYPDNPRAAKAIIAGKYVGVTVEAPSFNFGTDNRTPEFLAKNPLGKVPVLETPEGYVWESNAIARYVARLGSANIYGSNHYETGLIDQWIDFTVGEIDLPAAAWLYPILGFVENNPNATSKAKGDIRKVLEILNKHLQDRTFLVGERVSLADIIVVCSLLKLYTLVLDSGFRKAFVNTNRWFLTCINQPNFKSVLGEVKLCEKMAVAPAPKAEAAAPVEEKKEAKPEPKPKQEAPKPKPKPQEEEEDDDLEETKEKKLPNPLDSLPPTPFVLDKWKGIYSNEKDTRGVAMKWFWENYDAAGWSLWICDYKFNHELEALYKVNNLVGGFLQRLDKLRKYGFGTVLIFGEDPKFQVAGAWLFRGAEVPAEMKECDDYELYAWTKVDINDPAQKVLVEDYWCWAGEFGGKHLPFHDQGKIYR